MTKNMHIDGISPALGQQPIGEFITWSCRSRGGPRFETSVANVRAALLSSGLPQTLVEKVTRDFKPRHAMERAIHEFDENRVIKLVGDIPKKKPSKKEPHPPQPRMVFQFTREYLRELEEGGRRYDYVLEMQLALDKETGDIWDNSPPPKAIRPACTLGPKPEPPLDNLREEYSRYQEQLKDWEERHEHQQMLLEEYEKLKEEHRQRRELVRRAQQAFAKALDTRYANDITRITQAIFENSDVDLIPIGERGNYLVMDQYRSFVDQVEKFLHAIGPACRLVRLSIAPDASSLKTASEAIEETLSRLVAEHQDAIQKFKDSTRSSTLEREAQRIEALQLKLKAYTAYLSGEATEKFQEALEAAQEAVEKAIEAKAQQNIEDDEDESEDETPIEEPVSSEEPAGV
jgi:exonuclease VII large subunit